MKPNNCTFCESDNLTIKSYLSDKQGHVQCLNCGAKGPDVKVYYIKGVENPWHKEAIEAWNTRHLFKSEGDFVQKIEALAEHPDSAQACRNILKECREWREEDSLKTEKHYNGIDFNNLKLTESMTTEEISSKLVEINPGWKTVIEGNTISLIFEESKPISIVELK